MCEIGATGRTLEDGDVSENCMRCGEEVDPAMDHCCRISRLEMEGGTLIQSQGKRIKELEALNDALQLDSGESLAEVARLRAVVLNYRAEHNRMTRHTGHCGCPLCEDARAALAKPS